jgi:hypothetical protein
MATNAKDITFSSRPLSIGEIELSAKAAKGDLTAMIDFMVARSDPQVTREDICALLPSEVQEVAARLKQSIDTSLYIAKLFGQFEGM